ncbi:MAG: hypothetical protein ACJASB_001485 [Shewanella psychromarinicola]|jgi:hypothetical protein
MTGHSRPVIGFSMWVAAAETVIKKILDMTLNKKPGIVSRLSKIY